MDLTAEHRFPAAKLFLEPYSCNFPSGPVVKTLHFHRWGQGFDPWFGELRSQWACSRFFFKNPTPYGYFLYCYFYLFILSSFVLLSFSHSSVHLLDSRTFFKLHRLSWWAVQRKAESVGSAVRTGSPGQGRWRWNFLQPPSPRAASGVAHVALPPSIGISACDFSQFQVRPLSLCTQSLLPHEVPPSQLCLASTNPPLSM